MLDHISKLTDDELRIICELVPLQYFRDCFKGSPQKFHKIWSSCRPEKVTLEILQRLAVSHRRTPFMSDVLNNGIQILLDTMQDRLTAFTDADEDLHTALLRLLPNSQFSEYVDLYLKLSNPSYAPEYSELMRSALKEIEEAKKAAETAQEAIKQDGVAEVELKELHEELEKMRKELDKQRAKETEQNNAYSELKKELQEKKQELAGFQTLIDHADFSTDDPLDEKYPYVSLCRVFGMTERSTKLIRLADIADGVIQTRWLEDFPSRSDLYTEDSFQPIGFIGIWAWRIGSNPYTGTDGYVFSEFLTNQRPVQIILVPDCRTVEDLKERLLRGVNCCPEGERVLFSFANGGKYAGLLCERKNLLLQGETAVLSPNIAALNLYSFSESDIVKFGRLWFFYRVNLGIAKERVQIADPFNIVKKLLCNGPATMKKLRPIFGGATSQKIREFLNEIPTLDFYETVAAACDCTLEEGKGYIDGFILRAGTYLREDDVETEVLEAALEHSADLLERCRKLNEERWRQEHTEQIEIAKTELEQILDEVQQKTALRDRLSKEQKRLEEQQEILSSSITQKEQLAKDVEKQVALRIDSAKKNAADFICEMAFAYPGVIGQPIITATTGSGLFQPGKEVNSELMELHDAWDAVCSIQDELERAGVSEKRSMDFAAFLYAAYTLRMPLLLAGPNGRDIADALSVALFGRSASVLRCENDYFPSAVEECMCSEGQIAVIINPLNSGWIHHISELTSRKEKFLMMIHPFAEDLLIEPRGLYNYILPVLTELFVERSSSGTFRGGYIGNGFVNHVHSEPQKRIPLMEKVAKSPLVQGRLRQILADTKALLRNGSPDDDFLFGVVPYAYVTGKIDILREELQSGHAISKDTRSLLQTFLGEPE